MGNVSLGRENLFYVHFYLVIFVYGYTTLHIIRDTSRDDQNKIYSM